MGIEEIVLQVKNALVNNQFLEGGFILGMMAAVGKFLLDGFRFLWGRVKRYFTYTVNVNDDTPMFNAVNNVIRLKYYHKTRDIELEDAQTIHTGDETDSSVLRDDSFLIWFKWQPISISVNTRELNMAGNNKIPLFKTITLSSYFTRKTINKFLEDTTNTWEESNNKSRKTININGLCEGWWQTINVLNKRPLDSVITPITKEFSDDLESFLKSKDWYVERGIPYKRGYLLHGEPGNGKTSLTKVVASHADLDIYYLSLNDVTDKTMSLVLSRIYARKGFILLLEDLDSFIVGRKIKGNKELSFSTILNLLDGTLSKDGMITIFTTNKPDVMDAALVRAGRIDRKFYVENPTSGDVTKYVGKFFNTKVSDITVEDMTMAQIQEYCIENKGDVQAAITAIEGGKPVLKGVSELTIH